MATQKRRTVAERRKPEEVKVEEAKKEEVDGQVEDRLTAKGIGVAKSIIEELRRIESKKERVEWLQQLHTIAVQEGMSGCPLRVLILAVERNVVIRRREWVHALGEALAIMQGGGERDEEAREDEEVDFGV